MKTLLDDGRLNLDAFHPRLLEQTSNLETVLAAAQKTASSQVESTHFFLALTQIPAGPTREFFGERGFDAIWGLEEGLAEWVAGTPGTIPPPQLSLDTFGVSARDVMSTLDTYLESDQISKITEAYLLLATLRNLSPSVEKFFRRLQIPAQKLVSDLEKRIAEEDEYLPPPSF